MDKVFIAQQPQYRRLQHFHTGRVLSHVLVGNILVQISPFRVRLYLHHGYLGAIDLMGRYQ